MSFARTKIQPPRSRAGALVERPLLESRLAEALLSRRLVLISAAAGFGKTTALARQIERLPEGTALAWVAADEGDDLPRLLECAIAALEPFDLPWRVAPEALIALADEARGRARIVDELVNALDGCEVAHGVLAIDDLHRVDDGAFFECLDRLLERLSPRWTLALATRHDPPLALARLRAQDELAEFRQEDLRFDRAEVLAMVTAAGAGNEAAAQAEALLVRTQGWAAGLRLGLSRGGHLAPGAGRRAMFEFLAAEVIDRIEPGLRRFLMHSAVLPELTAARAAAVTGDARAALRLDELERLGLFVTSLDAAEPTLRLHDLFREALLERLRREAPEAWPALWQRAAAGEGDPARQLAMLLQAGDLEAAAEALQAQAPALLTDGAMSTVAHLIDQFPGSFVADSPPMQLTVGLTSWARWDFGTMAAVMRRAEAGFTARGDAEGAQAALAYQCLALNALGRSAECGRRLGALRRESLSPTTRVVVLVACLWHALDLGATARIGPLLDELMDLLESSDDTSLWYRGHPLPRLNGLPGTAAPLQRYVQGALRLAGDRPMPLRAMGLAQAAWHHAWQEGDLDAAEALLAAAQDDSRWLGDPTNVKGTLQLLAAFLPAMRGQRERALAAARALVEEHAEARGAWSLWANTYYAARLAGQFEDRAMLQRHLAWLEPVAAEAVPAGQQALLAPLRAQAAWLAGDWAVARRLWQAALEQEGAMDRLGQPIETRLWLAAALADDGQASAAGAVLAPVLERVAAGAGIGAVLMARPALRRLVEAGAALPPAQQQALARWHVLAQRLACAAAPAATREAAASDGGLSARELEVLARIAAGDSNKHIARAFDLSPHTVKRHVANILDKLGASSRGQAAAWFRERG